MYPRRTQEAVMIKKLTKHGNSYALVIDRSIMELLRISEKSSLYVTTDGKNLIVSPAKEDKQREKFDFALKEVNRKYGKALKRLS
jgi:antitoxin component of MazEF toxin-antitoxin module